MFNIHSDGTIKLTLNVFIKKVKIITTTMLVGLNNYVFIPISYFVAWEQHFVRPLTAPHKEIFSHIFSQWGLMSCNF